MEGSQSDIPNSQPVPTNVQEKKNIYEDEINLIDYFRVFWKRKYFIVLGSALLTLVVGLIIFLRPRDYKVTYVYDVKDRDAYDVNSQSTYDVSNWNLDEKNYDMLLDRFYSAENIDKIANKLRGNGLDRYAELISGASGREDSKKLIDFEVLPPYLDFSKLKVTDPAQLEQIRRLEALLLKMTIAGRPKNDIPKISLVIRDNFENVIPVSLVEEQLNAAARTYKAKMADIEENRFGLELDLETSKSVLAKLKNTKTKIPDGGESNITLQFDIGGKTEYLPIEYQIQAIEAKTIQVEEEILANEKNRSYYENLLALNERLLAKLKNNGFSYYTIQQFHSFLTGLVDNYNNKELKDYLSSYIKRVENRMSASAPVTKKPKVYAVPKDTAKKSAIVFVVLLMILTFAAFLLEGIQKSQARAS